MNNNPIGLFDSGIGGASVLKKLLKIMPNENYFYFSDSAHNPYGDKEDSELLNISKSNVEYLLSKKCKCIVIACNTASLKTTDYLRENYTDIPIFAIEPAYKVVHDYAYEKPTIIMATKGTIESTKFNELFAKYDNHKTILLPCVGLADIIEKGDLQKINEYLEKILFPYRGKIENVVLGCTHYAFIQKEIEKNLGKVTFFYGAEALARHVFNSLKEKDLLNNSVDKRNIQFYDNFNQEEKEKRFWDFIRNPEVY